jgi:hypothetical protein
MQRALPDPSPASRAYSVNAPNWLPIARHLRASLLTPPSYIGHLSDRTETKKLCKRSLFDPESVLMIWPHTRLPFYPPTQFPASLMLARLQQTAWQLFRGSHGVGGYRPVAFRPTATVSLTHHGIECMRRFWVLVPIPKMPFALGWQIFGCDVGQVGTCRLGHIDSGRRVVTAGPNHGTSTRE